MSNYYQYDGKGPLRVIIYVLVFFLAMILYSFLSSCSVQSHMARKRDKAMRACDVLFPPTSTIVTNTQYIPGLTVYDTAEIYVDCDSVLLSSKMSPVNSVQIRRVKVPCPPSTHKVDTVVRTVTETKTNTIKEQVLTQDLAAAQADVDRLKKGRTTWRWIAIAGIVLLLGGTALKIFTKRLG
jgi:hypothetical protein